MDASLLLSPQWLAALCAAQRHNFDVQQASETARSVYGVLQALGLTAELQKRSPDGNLIVDIEVTLPGSSSRRSAPGMTVAFEVDGPTHFMRNNLDAADGATHLRNAHLDRVYGHPVVSLNIVKERWHALDNKARKRLLIRLLGLSGAQPKTL